MLPKRLVLLAKLVAAFHLLLFVLAATLPLAIALTSSTISKPQIVVLLYAGGIIAGTTLGQLLFQGDCPLTVLEFCLRGLGGEKFPHSGLRTMAKLAKRGMAPRDIYRRLLWRSSVYTLIVGVAIITAAILITPAF